MSDFHIIEASASHVPVILGMIRELAEYERLTRQVSASEEKLHQTLFGPKPAAEVILAICDNAAVGFALFFPTYSTFLAQPGIYLEDLYVQPHMRGKGIGRALITHLARLGVERNCGRVEWEVLNWNEPSIRFYEKLGAVPMNEWTKYRLTGEDLKRVAG
jgi:GNAT superfamily N-acetyltransferase